MAAQQHDSCRCLSRLATTQTKMWFVNPRNPEEKDNLEHSELQQGQHSPRGRHFRALPPLASFRRGFPRSQTPSPHAEIAATGVGRDRGSAQLRKQRIDTAWRGGKGAGWGWIRYSQLELQARCEFLTCTLCREAFREQGRGTGTAVGLQLQTVSKWVSICLSTQSAGRITPTAQSHHGSYPHRRRREGGISEKRLSLMCQSNKKKNKPHKTCSFAALSSLLK